MRDFIFRVRLFTWGSRIGLITMFCTEQLQVILSHLQQISVNFHKIYSVNARFYFQCLSPYMDPRVGLTTLFCTEQLPVIQSQLQQISANFDKILQCEHESNKFRPILIKFYSVNAKYYFQGPTLDVGSTCNSSHTDFAQSSCWSY